MRSSVPSATGRKPAPEERADELLRLVGLYDYRYDLATSLPYGHQRRLEIARALASNPKLLLLDEPAAGMNEQGTGELLQFIGQIRDMGYTILLIEHDMKLVMSVCDIFACSTTAS